MFQAEGEAGRLDLDDPRLHFPRVIPLQDLGFQTAGDRDVETMYKYGPFPDVFYALFPHLASTGIAEAADEITAQVKKYCLPTSVVEYEGARMLVTGSVGKMLAAERLPHGFFTPRRIFRDLSLKYSQVDVFRALSSLSIDVDFRFRPRVGFGVDDLAQTVHNIERKRKLSLPVTTTSQHIGSFANLGVDFGDRVRLDLGVLPKDDLRLATWQDNTRTAWPASVKDKFCVGQLEDAGVRVSTMARVLLMCEDASMGIEMADRSQAIVVGLRACLNRVFYPPRYDFVLPGTTPLWPYLEYEGHWQRFGAQSVGREHMIAAVQPQVTKGVLLSILCDPEGLHCLKRAHILDQMPLGSVLSDEEIEAFLESVRPDYGLLFRTGSLTANDCGPVKLAEFLHRDLPDLIPLMQLL